MNMDEPKTTRSGSLTDSVSDLETFGQAVNLLMNLSKYLDMAANSVMAGTLDVKSGEAFVRRAVDVYTDLRSTILDLIVDDIWATAGMTMLRPMEEVADILEAALVADQSHTWLETSIRRGAFEHRVKLLDMQLGLEQAAASAQLGEQLEKAQVFEKRHASNKNSGGGTYV
jgi:hypothetical protein